MNSPDFPNRGLIVLPGYRYPATGATERPQPQHGTVGRWPPQDGPIASLIDPSCPNSIHTPLTTRLAGLLAHPTQHQLIEPVGKRGGVFRQFAVEDLRLLQQQKR